MSLPVTEDTPPDMLAGSMDLKVILPDGRTVKMSIQRSTPMMDLLVQATTAHCLNPGDFSLQAMGDKRVLPFKPNTPIGALDTFTVKIVEKKLHSRSRAPQVPHSFLNSFRLQVHLPRSQLFVIRVTPDVTLSEIMTHICTEKNLNMDKYEFRNTGNLEEVLDLNKTLGYYKIQELSMISKGNRTVTGLMSSADILNVKCSKHRQNSMCDSSLSSGSFGSRSGSPVPATNVVTMPPQPPIRKKRRPAPKPPSFSENEAKSQTTSSVLISHSRESSDSSGYHEASVLSESPTHGGPPGRMENESPPDSLPRRSKLPPSQSFTNLTFIPPAPRSRLTNSVSNTSLNSNGHSRKKRAPPPPPKQALRDHKIKSSTLPTSVTEERRNGSNFVCESPFRHFQVDASEEEATIKVQNPPTEITSELDNETKACSKNESCSSASLDLDCRLPPKPKPRTVVPKKASVPTPLSKCQSITELDFEKSNSEEIFRHSGTLNRWNNLENLTEELNEDPIKVVKNEKSQRKDFSEYKLNPTFCSEKDLKNCLLVGCSEVQEEHQSIGNQNQGDQDSINWEYQLPPPPTDFRDTNSPNGTEFGTVTITPEILENLDDYSREKNEKLIEENCERTTISQISSKPQESSENRQEISKNENQIHFYFHSNPDKKSLQNKSEVMCELTNILNGKRNYNKEKSLSVSNLCINDSNPKDLKKNALNYSRSFSTEPICTQNNFKLSTCNTNGLDAKTKLSSSNEIIFNNEINLKNNINLEKSSSMECIQSNSFENQKKFIGKTDEEFKKPVAPIQKKLKVAKRSASSIGVNTFHSQQKNSPEINVESESWSDDSSINVLRQQFLEFLKEKKFMSSDLNMKSLDVIRNILPELNGEKIVENNNSCGHINQKTEIITQSNGLDEEKLENDKVKIVDVKVKSPSVMEELMVREDTKNEKLKFSPEKKQEVSKRYSYQGPPCVNFGTWGERPKTTRIIIKDEDYVTQEKVIEKRSEMAQSKSGNELNNSKLKETKKPTQIFIKKPGGLSHYEMFSALPRKKEISSLELVQLEDEEKKKKIEAKEFNRAPVVCGVELKKEFKYPSPSTSSSPEPEPPIEPQTNKRHSVSVYVNGNQDHVEREKVISSMPCYSFILPKRNSALMPVVKGFRPLEENTTANQENISKCNNHINININAKKEVSSSGNVAVNQRISPKTQTNGLIPPPPPPPPNISLVKLKSVSNGSRKSKVVSLDPREQLLNEIRNFSGFHKVKY